MSKLNFICQINISHSKIFSIFKTFFCICVVIFYWIILRRKFNYSSLITQKITMRTVWLVFLQPIQKHLSRLADLHTRHALCESSKMVSSWGCAGVAVRSCGRVGETCNQCAHSGEATDPHTTDFPIESNTEAKNVSFPIPSHTEYLHSGFNLSSKMCPVARKWSKIS